ncbi:unnamed protein product [Cuscuta campestris]|uniref:Uncharacterized protein n=1 Tax=Cuscuta campestris TaxID=132261 RepID=A0A484LGR4_9ASTE|nr:unnamed protein product [Cuscuta campestris]
MAETSEVLQKHMTNNQRNYLVSLKEPLSPGRPPVELQQCIDELLRHTISSSVSRNLETDIGLSKEFCTNLLDDDPSNPTVPLYKRLATSINRFISSGSILQSDSRVALKQEACSLKQKEDEFNYKLVWEKGRELLYMLERVDFELHVQEPFFSYLKSGEKTIEGRCAIGHYNK